MEKKEIIFENGTKAIPTELEGCYEIIPRVFGDSRGGFCPSFIKEYMEELGFEEVCQTNESYNSKGVVRGLHFQLDPYAQAKIVSVSTGAVVDIVVDIREGSPSYGKGIAVLLTPYNPDVPGSGNQLFVPRGFAHGFVSIKDNTTFKYLVDNKYMPTKEDGISYKDEAAYDLFKQVFAEYDIDESKIELSDKDAVRLTLKQSPKYFEYKKPVDKTRKEYSFEDGV